MTAQLIKKSLKAFTFVELLIVMAIAGIVFSMFFTGLGITGASFSASQTTKNITLLTRSARRQSMLITKSSLEPWVYGVGIEFSKNAENIWQYKTIKMRNAVGAGVGSSFYIAYPSEETNLASNLYEYADFGESFLLPKDLSVFVQNNSSPGVALCPSDIFIVIFESVNGTPYFYCDRQATTATAVDIKIKQGLIDRGQVIGITKGGNIFAYEP